MKRLITTCLLTAFLMMSLFGEKVEESEEKLELKELKKKIAVNQKHYNTEKGDLMLEGYDVVSYHESKGPVEGSKKYSLTHEGVVYYFSGEKNKEIFKANPENYIPLYGGWCAYALSKNGKKVPVDPESYKIIDGKLYLYYNTIFKDTLKAWNKLKDDQGQIKKADKGWDKFIKEKK